jgi:putative hemolysin
MWSEFWMILALILASGVFAGAEIAVVALRATRVRELAESGDRAARALEQLRRDPERFLSTVQVVITVIGAAAAAFGGAAFAEDLAPLFAEVEVLAPYAEQIALGLVVALVSFLSLLLGELVPKSLALRASEPYARLVSRPLLGLSLVLKPVVWFLTTSANFVLRLFGDRTTFMESRISLDELRSIVDEASERGSVEPEVGELATRALEFSELTAADVMVHRRSVVGLPKTATEAEVRERMVTSGHQRLPVFDGTLDNIIGYVSWRDIVQRTWSGAPLVLGDMLRPAHFVPESRPAPELLEDMRSRRIHLAIAVDEHGGTAGIVTLEDLLEELVGEITSEHAPAGHASIERQGDGSALVVATTPIRDVNRELELELEEPEDVTTIAGLCMQLAGDHIPSRGERFKGKDGTVLEIADASPRRVRSVRVVPVPPPVAGGA